MKSGLITITCAWIILVLPMVVYAVSGWTAYASVIELTSTGQGRYLVKLKVTDNPSGCKNKETFYQDYGSSGSAQMFRILLEAVTAEKMVRVYVTGFCDIDGYSEISSVSIVP